ncbi:unnamed protein product [Caenorhabditis auriculariae]|uniref:receptor protein-tyrosine kinase n=1 Tax=Caenorhabditis auriculariae TaxID=2777116 RepID=A0A8S1GNM2_9PELO|nr:unnamed protein product [Caenorhabditis auriculariae]
MDGIARVFLAGGASRSVRYDNQTTVERVIQVVLRGVNVSQVSTPHFALRLIVGPTPKTAGSGDSLWLHPLLRVSQLPHVFANYLPIGVNEELKLELLMRFMPESVYELQVTDSEAFTYLHEQVVEEFFAHVAWKTNLEVALEIAALKVCRDSGENKAKHCVDHKLELEDFDVESCLQSLLPNTAVCTANVKGAVKKQFVQLIKKLASLSPSDSIVRSLTLLLDVVKFDVEVFKASLGIGWTNPVELVVGPHAALSYRINDRCDTSRLLELRTIAEITVRRLENSSEKTLVQLRLSGGSLPVAITVSGNELAQSLAHLLDGYQMLYNQRESVYKLPGIERCETLEMRAATVNQKNTPVENDMRLQRDSVTLKELIGGGQFGNVYKAIYHNQETAERIAVAVKVCKLEAEPADTQLILQESSLMRNFRHAHIITLIGVCMEQPMWLVMELASRGELREYLQAEKDWLPLRTLLLFCSQLASALVYLHASRFVHRDIAARNVLVCSPLCVKLADFGLSRALDYDAVYTASRGKLPIKWLAPESVNFRQFSMASDVWMFGVCMWEILSLGTKPWVGVPNADVITHIEQGIRPARPEECPVSLYSFIEKQVWALEAHKRPTIDQVAMVVENVLAQTIEGVEVTEIRVCKPVTAAGVIVAEMSSLPSLTLYRTLEEQRRQAEEDDKWLEEEQDEIPPSPEKTSPQPQDILTSTFPRRITHVSNGVPVSKAPREDSAQRELRESVENVCESVSRLQNSFNNLMDNDEFLVSIRKITTRLREMFSKSSQLTRRLAENDERRREVDVTETLIANDMKQMSRVMNKLHQNDPVTFNANRRDVVRICGELAVNCQTFLVQLSMPSLESDFQAMLSDC